MTTVNTLISDALIDLGKLNPEETAPAIDLVYGLRVLNRLIAKFTTRNLLIPYTTSESFSLVSGTTSYTMGSGGTASSTRAVRLIDNCYLRDSNNLDYPLALINQQEYNSISNKSLTGMPDRIFYDPLYPIGYIYFWRVPTSGFTAYIESIKLLHSSLSLNDTVSISPEYEDFFVISLRNRLANSFGIAVSADMRRDELIAERDIMNLNLSNRSVTMDMPAGFGGETYPYTIENG